MRKKLRIKERTEKKPVRKAQKEAKKKKIRKSKYPVIPEEKLEDMYLNEKMSMNQIHGAVGVEKDNSLFLRNQLIKYGIPIRTRKDGRKIARKAKKVTKK